MRKLGKFTIFVITLIFSASALAAGDYILEEKFQSEIGKAEKGDIKSQYAIGEMYEKGRGTDRDFKKAFDWYSKASNKGYKKAEYKLGMAYLNGKGVRKNHSKAYEWLKKSADKGYVRAQYHLATLYENGQGTKQDLSKSLSWYKRALKGGYDAAEAGMKRVVATQQKNELAALQAQAVSRSKAIQKKSIKSKRAKPAKKPAVKAAPLTTMQRVMAGGWKKRSKPAEYLPSSSTQCKEINSRVECLSQSLTRNIGVADIEYQSKAILYSFKDKGSFKISYRNNVTKVTITDAELLESKGKAPVKMGWQDAEHKLVCTFRDDKNLACKKNNLRTIKLHR